MRQRDRLRRLRPHLLPVAWALAIAVLTLPAAYTRPGVGLDPSWLAALNMGFQQHLRWGRDLVWTYGPFGFADFTAYYFFDTWRIALAVTLLVHGLFLVTLVAFLRSTGGSRWRWAVMAALFLIPLSAFPSVEYECTLIALLLLFRSAIAAHRWQAALLAIAGGGAVGLLVTIKGTGLAAAAALLIAYAVFVLVERHPALLATLAASVLVSFLALWMLAGQPLSQIVPYLRGSYEIVSGYSAAMSLLYDAPFPVRHVTAQVLFGVLVIASSTTSLVWSLLRRDRQLTCLLMLVTPLLFLDFKEGYVRFGNRQLVFYSLAALLETIVFVRALRAGPGRWPAWGWVQSGAVATICAVLMSGAAAATSSVPAQTAWPEATLGTRLASYWDATLLIASSQRRAELADSITSRIRDHYALGANAVETTQTIDILPWDVEIAYAYPLRWRPRPVVQSYSAYTPYLDQLDASYLEGPDAPERLLLTYGSVDGRYPLFDEPAAFRAILSGYELIGEDRDFLILSRRPAAGSSRLLRVSSLQAHLGDLIQVPSVPGGGIVYASVSVPYSFRGQLTNLLFQPAELHVRFRLEGGDAGPFRFIPRVAPDGLMLGSYVADLNDLGQLMAGTLARPIRAIQITADHDADYGGTVDVTFYASQP